MKTLLAVSVALLGLGAARIVPPETRTFTYSDGKEGGGGETITRNGDLISGEMWIGAAHAHYEGRVAPDGSIPRLDIRAWRSAAEAKNPRIVTAIVGRDSAKVIEHLGNRVDTLRFAAQPGTIPVINPSVGLLEVVVARARMQKARATKVPFLLIDALNLDSPKTPKIGAEVGPADVTFLPADTVQIGTPTSRDQLRLVVGADGRSRAVVNGSTAKDKFSARPASQ